MLRDRFGEQAALIEADVARRCADQARDRVPFHVLRHVEADQLDAHGHRELPRDLGLADAGRTGEQERADRSALVAETRARHLDRGAERVDRSILTEDHELQVALEVPQHVAVRCRYVLRRNPRDLRDDVLDQLDVDDLRPRRLGLEPTVRAGLVDHVDRLVGQVSVVDVPARRARLPRAAPRPST